MDVSSSHRIILNLVNVDINIGLVTNGRHLDISVEKRRGIVDCLPEVYSSDVWDYQLNTTSSKDIDLKVL